MEQENVHIGDNSTTLKMAVEVESGILSIGGGKLEFVALEAHKGKLVINFGSEEIYQLFEDCIKKDPYAIERPGREVDSNVGEFLFEMGYQKSETGYTEATFLFDEYIDYCYGHNLKYTNFICFIGGLESLGFKTKLCPIHLAVFVYCKKG